MTALDEVLKEAGAEFTIVACDDSSATQIGQIENFISAGCDLIMVHPSDAAAVEDVCAQAREAGIKVMCWDDPMENTDANWILDNTYLGTEIGKLAGAFINEHYSEDNKAEVIMIGYPQTKILLEREEGIMMGLEEVAPSKYEIVSNQAGLIASEAQTAVETALQAHPNAKVVTGIGAGAMIGADEARQHLHQRRNPRGHGRVHHRTSPSSRLAPAGRSPPTPAKGIIGFEGSDVDTATACASMYALILADNVGAQNVFLRRDPHHRGHRGGDHRRHEVIPIHEFGCAPSPPGQGARIGMIFVFSKRRLRNARRFCA